MVIAIMSALMLASCSPRGLIDTVIPDGSDLSFELNGNSKHLTSITVRQNGERKGRYKVDGESFSELNGSYGFEAVDLNFDGRLDFRVVSDASENSVRYLNFICNSDGTFYSHEGLDALVNPSLNTEEKYIESTSYVKKFDSAITYENIPRTYYEVYSTHRFTWERFELREIARNSITFYSESTIFCVGTYRIDSYGELSAVNEDWMSPSEVEEKYGSTGYYLPIE